MANSSGSESLSPIPGAVSSAGTGSHDHLLSVKAEQVRLLYAQAHVGLLVTLVTSIVVTAMLWSAVDPTRLLLWQSTLIAVTLGRARLLWHYWHTTPAPEQLMRWGRRFVMWAGLTGVAWGLSGVLCFPSESLGHQFFLSLVLCGMGVGSVAVFASEFRAFFAFLLPTMLPITFRLFLQGDSIYLALGSLSLVLMAALIALAHNLHRSLLESLRLRFENVALVQSLMVAKDRAEHASRIKSQFLANMSHEIRTPMNGVLGMTELLRGQALPDEARGYAEQAHASAKALLILINDILDLSKIEAGKVELERLAFAPHQVVTEVTSLFTAEAHKKGLRLLSDLQPTVPHTLYGDPYRLRQILTNLMGNALKFTHRGTVRLYVEALDVPEPGDIVLYFRVEDTGIGIAATTQEQLFQPFIQGDGSTTRQYGGTGLGLAISKQLVELMGGDIGVQSRPGEGSTFWFSVRFAIPQGAVAGVTGDGVPQHHLRTLQAPATHDHMRAAYVPRVLLVEDNPINQAIAQAMLRALGYAVEIAETGQEALAACRQITYDVILMDCQMPDMDGCVATQTIRRQEAAQRHTPIIAVTAHTMEEDRARCLAAGMDDYLSKPFSQDELRRVITRWLQTPAASA